MITELMLLLIAVGAGIVFVAWSNTRKRKQDAYERREVEESTGKLKQELERTANEIIGRMENHVTHLENVLDESERNRTQLEGRVAEMRKLIKKGESQSGEIRDLLAKLDDASAEVDAMQRKMDVVERKLNLAMATPLQIQQPVTIPQITPQSLVPPIMTPITPAPVAPINTPPVTKITTPPAAPLNPLGPITMPPLIRQTPPEPPKVEPSKVELPKVESPKVETETSKDFDKILEETISEPPKSEEPARPQARDSIVLSPENKQPMKVVEADPVKIEATRKRLTEASAKMAENPPEELNRVEQSTSTLRKKRAKNSRSGRDVRKAALEAIRQAEATQSNLEPPSEEPKKIIPPEKPRSSDKKEQRSSERRELKLETTDSSIIKEMLLSGMTIEEISRETGLGRGAIELVQELTRRQLNRR